MSENKDIGNVVQLRPQRKRTKKEKVNFEMEQRKITLAASIASILIVVTIANNQLQSSKAKSEQTRAIANTTINTNDKDIRKFEYDLADTLSEEAERDLASLGSRPTPIDELRFGLLEGKYSLRMNDGFISEIEFNETDKGDRPKYITNQKDFLNKHKQLFSGQFQSIVKVGEQILNNQVITRYMILGENSKPLAQAEFNNDAFGRLMKLKIQPPEQK